MNSCVKESRFQLRWEISDLCELSCVSKSPLDLSAQYLEIFRFPLLELLCNVVHDFWRNIHYPDSLRVWNLSTRDQSAISFRHDCIDWVPHRYSSINSAIKFGNAILSPGPPGFSLDAHEFNFQTSQFMSHDNKWSLPDLTDFPHGNRRRESLHLFQLMWITDWKIVTDWGALRLRWIPP